MLNCTVGLVDLTEDENSWLPVAAQLEMAGASVTKTALESLQSFDILLIYCGSDEIPEQVESVLTIRDDDAVVIVSGVNRAHRGDMFFFNNNMPLHDYPVALHQALDTSTLESR